jgi:hypothetical protein
MYHVLAVVDEELTGRRVPHQTSSLTLSLRPTNKYTSPPPRPAAFSLFLFSFPIHNHIHSKSDLDCLPVSSTNSPLESAIMGYTDLDQLAINTIRVLAVCPHLIPPRC